MLLLDRVEYIVAKEKLLIRSNFSLCCNVFKRCLQESRCPDKKGVNSSFPHNISLIIKSNHMMWGTRKNRLNETILLSTHIIGLYCLIKMLEHAKRPLSRALGEVSESICIRERVNNFKN